MGHVPFLGILSKKLKIQRLRSSSINKPSHAQVIQCSVGEIYILGEVYIFYISALEYVNKYVLLASIL